MPKVYALCEALLFKYLQSKHNHSAICISDNPGDSYLIVIQPCEKLPRMCQGQNDAAKGCINYSQYICNVFDEISLSFDEKKISKRFKQSYDKSILFLIQRRYCNIVS